MAKKILITGGTGLIGSGLTELLFRSGYTVIHLSRRNNPFVRAKAYRWNINKGQADEAAFEGISGIIHLAGEGIADKRWTKERKQQIVDSRVKSTELLYSLVQKNNIHLDFFAGASAVGYYGAVTTKKIFREDDPPADDFLGHCCRLWERSYEPFVQSGVRTVIVRVGVVLEANGGALKKMAAPVRKGFGAVLGSGRQYLPWIHAKDIHGIFLKAAEDPGMNGVYNGVAPGPVTHAALMKGIAQQLRKRLWVPHVPAFALRLAFGEMASAFLEGSRVSAEKIMKAGYRFQFPSLDDALGNLLRR